MSLSTTLSTISSLTQNPTSAQTLINNNFIAVNAALAEGLALNGQLPNSMTSNLDMNSNQILNLPLPATANSPVRLQDVQAGGTITNIPSGGTTGQVLEKTSNANYQVGWVTPGVSTAVTLLETLNPSASSNITSSASWSGYTSIDITWQLVFNSVAALYTQLHSNGSYQNTNYTGGLVYTQANGGTVTWNATGQSTEIFLSGVISGVNANPGTTGYVRIINVNSTTLQKILQGYSYAGVNYQLVNGSWTGGNTVLDGLQFYPGSGTMTGQIKIYGIL
jgi:hypothetical protein